MNAKLPVHVLTFLAEGLGRRAPVPLKYLAVLSRHPSPIVREGVVYGLARHVGHATADEVLRAMVDDSDRLVALAATEALE